MLGPQVHDALNWGASRQPGKPWVSLNRGRTQLKWRSWEIMPGLGHSVQWWRRGTEANEGGDTVSSQSER